MNNKKLISAIEEIASASPRNQFKICILEREEIPREREGEEVRFEAEGGGPGPVYITEREAETMEKNRQAEKPAGFTDSVNGFYLTRVVRGRTCSSELLYFNRKKAGRSFNGAARDAGYIIHIVGDGAYPSWESALCGTRPGIQGGGWQEPEAAEDWSNCPACQYARGLAPAREIE